MGKELENSGIAVIDLTATRKKKFQVLIDEDREPEILELNTSDAGIINRLNEVYPKLTKLANDAHENTDLNTEDPDLELLGKELKNIDSKMREYVDYLFDSNVSEICVPSGTLFDPFNGEFRFEYIIRSLSTLYGDNFSSEFGKMSKRMQAHTSKYKKSKR